jgi:hypothetical protein
MLAKSVIMTFGKTSILIRIKVTTNRIRAVTIAIVMIPPGRILMPE